MSITLLIGQIVLVKSRLKMEISILVNGAMENILGQEVISLKMVTNTLVSGKIINLKA